MNLATQFAGWLVEFSFSLLYAFSKKKKKGFVTEVTSSPPDPESLSGDQPGDGSISPGLVPWVPLGGVHLTIPCLFFCFPFCGSGSSDLSAEDYYSNEKHFQEISPRQT